MACAFFVSCSSNAIAPALRQQSRGVSILGRVLSTTKAEPATSEPAINWSEIESRLQENSKPARLSDLAAEASLAPSAPLAHDPALSDKSPAKRDRPVSIPGDPLSLLAAIPSNRNCEPFVSKRLQGSVMIKRSVTASIQNNLPDTDAHAAPTRRHPRRYRADTRCRCEVKQQAIMPVLRHCRPEMRQTTEPLPE